MRSMILFLQEYKGGMGLCDVTLRQYQFLLMLSIAHISFLTWYSIKEIIVVLLKISLYIEKWKKLNTNVKFAL